MDTKKIIAVIALLLAALSPFVAIPYPLVIAVVLLALLHLI